MTLVNGSFEDPLIAPNSFSSTTVQTGWTTNSAAPANRLETWRTPFTASIPGLLPYPDGQQIIELDQVVAGGFAEQTITVPAGAGAINWGYRHHRRNASDRVRLRIGDATLPVASNAIVDDHTATNNVWNSRAGAWPKPLGVTEVRFRFQKVSPLSGLGSLLDTAFAEFQLANDEPSPCNCCPTGLARCHITQTSFASATAVNSAPVTNLPSTIDGTAGADLSGFAPPVTQATLTANPQWGMDYAFPAPRNGLTRLRWANGGGGILTDQDGFGLIRVQFLDAALTPIGPSLVWDLTAPAANNTIVRELNFPPVSGVDRVRFDQFNKQNAAVMGTGSPLLRQVEAFVLDPVHGMRCDDGEVHWFDSAGNEPNPLELADCPESAPDPCTPPLQSANDTPWVVAAGGQTAVKVINGVTVTGRITGSNPPGANAFIAGCPAGACDPNALTLRTRQGGGFADVEFDASDAQTFTTVRVIDLDHPNAPLINERVVFQAPHNVNADANTPVTAPGGSPGGINFVGAGTWEAPLGTSQRSAELTWNSIGWGGGTPLKVRFITTGGNINQPNASQWDFGGVPLREDCQ